MGFELAGQKQKRDWKRLLAFVRDLMNREWDPIGVLPTVTDEYDTYALEITRLLLEGADAYKIAERLTNFERGSMGLESSLERNRKIAERFMHAMAEATKADAD